MTPDEIERLFEGTNPAEGSDSEDVEDDASLSNEVHNFRIRQLKEVLQVAEEAWASGSEILDQVAEKLANGSRDASWRAPIGESGLLNFFLSKLHVDGLRQPLVIHSLRLIGNSCADTDENRARVVESQQMRSVVKLFSEDALLPFLIPVTYNVCLDYEPTQLEACKASLSSVLLSIIDGPRLDNCRHLLSIICKILKLLVTQEPEANLASPGTPVSLLKTAISTKDPPDLEDFCGLISVALAYLTHEQFQTHLLTSGHCDLLMQCFEDSYSRFDISSADEEEAADLKQIWAAKVQIFADISASAYFASLPLDSPLVERLVTWLGRSNAPYPHLQTAACLSLGNLARSDVASTALLKTVYNPISAMLTSATPPTSQLLHANLSFIKNLSIPTANKPVLGGLLLEPVDGSSVLSRLWTSTETQPQTQFAAISLTRLLVAGCPANVNRLCSPLTSDPFSPNQQAKTNLHLLLSTTSRSDAEPTKLEGARTAAAVCKALHTISSPHAAPSDPPLLSWASGTNDDDYNKTTYQARERFYTAHEVGISNCLGVLLTQSRFPALRSEALFTMALMSRSRDGAKLVCRALEPAEVSAALVEAVTGRSATAVADGPSCQNGEGSGNRQAAVVGGRELNVIEGLGLEPQQASPDPAQAASVAKIDRENGLVLVAELLRQDDGVLPPSRRGVLEDMLKAGGEMVISERQKEQSIS